VPQEIIPRELVEYLDPRGRSPFGDWIRKLKDMKGRALIRKRLNRIRMGNLGDCRSVGNGVKELRIAFGPGYRVYFGEDGTTIVVLLCGGDKGSQESDIHQAKLNWAEYWR
jgi:putative addiction module killer protein